MSHLLSLPSLALLPPINTEATKLSQHLTQEHHSIHRPSTKCGKIRAREQNLICLLKILERHKANLIEELLCDAGPECYLESRIKVSKEIIYNQKEHG
ncbi:hypothetical protein Tco_0754378 [Tanacetum coccineum]